MSIAKIATDYAPDVYKALSGIVLVHKPVTLSHQDFVHEIRLRISDQLNQLRPRPLSSRLCLEHGDNVYETKLIEKPNLSDHPLVVGPRYVPWELSMMLFRPCLSERSSGVTAFALGEACGVYCKRIQRNRLINVYHVTGKFGYMTSNCFSNGKIMDKNKYHHIRSSKFNSILARIETSQNQRLFDSSNVLLSSQEAYELAKAWPSRPPKMAEWPVIYRLRCLDLKLPEFKLEVTVVNEKESFLGQLIHEIGILNRTSAYCESIRRVKLGPFSIDDCLTYKDWDLQSILNNIARQESRRYEIDEVFRHTRRAGFVRDNHQDRAEAGRV